MARAYEYIISGPLAPPGDQPVRPHKTLSIKRDSKHKANLRTLYRNSSSPAKLSPLNELQTDQYLPPSTAPHLPPTPPAAEADDDQAQEPPKTPRVELPPERSALATPVHQHSPPTPEQTPPRDGLRIPPKPFLALRPSFASTRAESFRTARENLYSDDDSEPFSPDLLSTAPLHAPQTDASALHESTLHLEPPLPVNVAVLTSSNPENLVTLHATADAAEMAPVTSNLVGDPTPELRQDFQNDQPTIDNIDSKPNLGGSGSIPIDTEDPISTDPELPKFELGVPRSIAQSDRDQKDESTPNQNTVGVAVTKTSPVRSKSLRDRLEEAKRVQRTTSTEKFANIIGWTEGITLKDNVEEQQQHETDPSRWSGTSTISAVEAYVVESPLPRPKRGTLRKVHKTDSLRAASSPISDVKRDSLPSKTDSPPRLTHKKVKLSNQNRWSNGSDFSRSLSLGSSPAWNKPEVIKVAVVPRRDSSLQSSAENSNSRSRSISGNSARTNSRKPSSSYPEPSRRKRAYSESEDLNPRDRKYPPQVPARTSSLSAPTSRSGSRANSISSDRVSAQRQQAENDLRITLDRMQSNRLVQQSSDQGPNKAPETAEDGSIAITAKEQDVIVETSNAKSVKSTGASSEASRKPSHGESILPGTKEWADLRPSTIHGTPFSHISMLSRSPEIIEATAVNLYPHNNKSVQLIEPNPLEESHAVRELRKQHPIHFNTINAVSVDTTTLPSPAMPKTSYSIDSPLRNPRPPPNPPQVKFVPPTPNSELDEARFGVTPDTSPEKKKNDSLRLRPSIRPRGRSDSFVKSLTRNFSTRKATNLKANQELDSKLHPFWRPRAFWDDEDYERVRQMQEQGKLSETGNSSGRRDVLEQDMTQPNALGIIPIAARDPINGPISLIRRLSDRHRHLTAQSRERQQELNRQSSFSSLQRIRASRKLYKFPGRSISLNMGNLKLTGLRDWQERLWAARAKKEDEKREKRRDAIRRSIGVGVISQGDSRFPASGRNDSGIGSDLNPQLDATAETLVGKRGLRL